LATRSGTPGYNLAIWDSHPHPLAHASLSNSDLRLKQSCAATGWTPARLRQLPFVEREATRATPRGKNHDTISSRLSRSDRMPEILFSVPACQAQVAPNGRHRSRLGPQQGDQILPNGHACRHTWVARLSSRNATKDAGKRVISGTEQRNRKELTPSGAKTRPRTSLRKWACRRLRPGWCLGPPTRSAGLRYPGRARTP
jgi:hypothetical protein